MQTMRAIPKSLFPFDGKYFDRGGPSMHYLDEGAGEPVVMVHGNPTWSFYYRNLVLALRDKYRCIAPDHVGCGMSDKPGDDRYSYTLESRVNDLEALLDSLSIVGGVTLVVHDWGGMIGMAYATRHPERIKRLVILNTAAFRLPEAKTFPWPLRVVRNTPLGTPLVRGLNAFSGIAARVCCTRHPLTAEVRAAYTAPYDSWANRIATLRFVQDVPLNPSDVSYGIVENVQQNLTRFSKVPMLICWGLKDFVFDRHFLERWEGHFPHAEVHRFEDCGHYILEDGKDEVIPLVQGFLART